jgi:hypothetical protein
MSENTATADDDITAIRAAYQDALTQQFASLLDGILLGTVKNNQAQIAQAEERFKAGLIHTRLLRDRALALLAIPPAARPHSTAYDDISTIKAAYQEALKKSFGTLLASAGGNQGQMTLAEQHFSAGLSIARLTRDRALALVVVPPVA